ncbi:MAG: superfamily protein [Labilithrix sp.]|nr:superfamily protein [Labilithrix sp.]
MTDPEKPQLWRLVPFVLYAAYSAARHDLRVEHFLLIGAVAALSFIGPRARALLAGLYPIALVGLLYDGMRPLQKLGLTADRVHVCDVRALESRLFGYAYDGAPMTLHDYFMVHHTTALDLFCAIPYATFIFVCIGTAIWLYRVDRLAMHRFTWVFFALNVAGFVTYHLVPAAPPWYFHAHGCAVDLATRASEGPVLARVDAYLRIGYFHGMYAKASSVFGAIPSLHCAYPMLVVVEGWRTFGPKLRAASVLYWMAMVFSAVYLDHHWVIDAAVGSAYAVLAALAMRQLQRRTAGGTSASARLDLA